MVDRQRLDGVFLTVHLGGEPQQGFVYGAGYDELERWVVAELHVREVLMREGFQDHRRDGRQAGFAVVAVPHAAAGPFDSHPGRNVALKTGQHQVVQVARSITGNAAVQFSVVESGGIDAQRANQCVVFLEAGIAVHSQGQFEGYSQSFFSGVIHGTSVQVIDHE